jgi:hypothetical protein
MTTFTEQQVERNMRHIAHAIAQQELEGLKVPEATVADLERVARGEIGTDEVIRNIERRVKNDQILRP